MDMLRKSRAAAVAEAVGRAACGRSGCASSASPSGALVPVARGSRCVEL